MPDAEAPWGRCARSVTVSVAVKVSVVAFAKKGSPPTATPFPRKVVGVRPVRYTTTFSAFKIAPSCSKSAPSVTSISRETSCPPSSLTSVYHSLSAVKMHSFFF